MPLLRTPIVLFSFLVISACHEQSKPISNPAKKNTYAEQSAKPFQESIDKPDYKKLTAGSLDTIPDDKLEDAVMDNIWYKMDGDLSDKYDVVMKLSEPQRVMFIVRQVEDEVNNGGFNQFYENSSGQFANDMEAAFKAIGALKYANLVHRANVIYKKNKTQITKYMDGTVEGFSKSYEDNPLNKLDDEFYALKEDLNQLKIDFIKKNKTGFTRD